MNFFSKDKDLILKITNLILIIGFIVTLIVFYNGFVNIVFDKQIKTYSIFQKESCDVEYCEDSDTICSIDGEKTEEEIDCEEEYELYKEDYKSDKVIYQKRMISSALSAITVGLAIYFINKGHKKKVSK